MEIEKTIAQMRLVGGHPCLDLVNTVDVRVGGWGPDLLRSYQDLITWAERENLVTQAQVKQLRALSAGHPKTAATVLEKTKVFREALYGVLRAESLQIRAPAGDVEIVQDAVFEAGKSRVLSEVGGQFSWGWMDNDGLEALFKRIAFGAGEFLAARPQRRGVRECPGPNCGWLFLDTSKAGRRRWCSDESCGSRSRVKRFRAK